MKKIHAYLIGVLIFCYPVTSFSQQLQRLSIMPQEDVFIAGDSPAEVSSICIDYHREAPSAENFFNQPHYNQVYSTGGVSVKINGTPDSRSFASLVQAETPLLLLRPSSAHEIEISINPDHPESGNIKSVELSFNAAVPVGNIPEDRNIEQAKIIFNTWGYSISQVDFWERSMGLDILSKNNLLSVNANNELTQRSKALSDKLFENYSFDNIPPTLFKQLVARDFFSMNEDLLLSKENICLIQQAYYYFNGLEDAQLLNLYVKELPELEDPFYKPASTTNNPSSPGAEDIDHSMDKYLSAAMKQLFYANAERLTRIDKSNKYIRDTIINGLRYVLMSAWKKADFNQNYIKQGPDNSRYYLSDSTFFKYPLFLTTQYDLEQFCIKNNLSELSGSDRRSRLMQVLGLPPGSTNDLFIECWVNEKDLFRPAIDSSGNCSLLLAKLSASYLEEFIKWSKGSYSNDYILYRFPFTGLGYTWDYSPLSKDHFGLTEFVLREHRKVFVRNIISTNAFIDGLPRLQ